jgi:hypothetical protein
MIQGSICLYNNDRKEVGRSDGIGVVIGGVTGHVVGERLTVRGAEQLQFWC